MGRYAVKALKKAESALHRGGYVMNTGAAFPRTFGPGHGPRAASSSYLRMLVAQSM